PQTNNPSPSTTPTKTTRTPTRPKPSVEATKKLLRETIIAAATFDAPSLEKTPAFLNDLLTKAGVGKHDLHFVLRDPFSHDPDDPDPNPFGPSELAFQSDSIAAILQLTESVLHFHSQVDKGVVFLAQTNPEQSTEPEQSGMAYIQHKLDEIVIPVIDFENATLEDAIDFLRQRSRELDRLTPDFEKKGINFVIRNRPPQRPISPDADPPGAPSHEPLVPWQAENVTLNDFLTEIARQTATSWMIDEFAITIVPKPAPPPPKPAPLSPE
ncbi:MAG: hypothetical protein O3A87_07700, partial [Verrucomicrobia bacterium]|nr:hypothetical protein [Verrucomicrobiota bacterium]